MTTKAFLFVFFLCLIPSSSSSIGPANYSLLGTLGSGSGGVSMKGRHPELEGDDTPSANAYSLTSDIGRDGAGASIKGRPREPKDQELPGIVVVVCWGCLRFPIKIQIQRNFLMM